VTLGILVYRDFLKYLITIKSEVKQSNANGILPNSLNIAKLVLVLLAPTIYLQK
jgi:hypothetical protein